MRPFAPVAQLDRVPDYESGGRTFESCQARHLQITRLYAGFFVGACLVEARCPFDKLCSKQSLDAETQ